MLFWFLLGLSALILAAIVIHGMDTPMPDVDTEFNEFQLDKFRAFDEIAQETWDNDMALDRRKRAIMYGLAVLATILIVAFILSSGG